MEDALSNFLNGRKNDYEFIPTIDDILNTIKLSGNYKFLSEEAEEKLNSLTNSGLDDIDFKKFNHTLRQNITNFDLDGLALKLRVLASNTNDEEISKSLTKNAASIEDCQKNYVIPIKNSTSSLMNKLMKLEKEIKINGTSVKDTINGLIVDVKKIENWINSKAFLTEVREKKKRSLLE